MNLDEIDKKCFILALFIRDDGQRFLLGSGAYEFKDSQLHFSANTMSNDVVEVQGNDGYLLAGQVRRPTTQVFDGYIGDASINKPDIEGYRRDFFAFFQKNHFYTVVYIFPDGTAIQRRRGFIVDASEVRELYQMFPEYHIGLNFEDVNYYKYSEDEDGNEQYAKSIDINISKAVSGGLIWDEVSQTQAYNHGTDFSISGTIEDEPVDYIELYGDTEQTTISGKNLFDDVSDIQYPDSTIMKVTTDPTIGSVTMEALGSAGSQTAFFNIEVPDANSTYCLSGICIKNQAGSSLGSDGRLWVRYRVSDNGTYWTGYYTIFEQIPSSVGQQYTFSGTISGHKYYQFLFYNYAVNGAPTGEKTTYTNIQLEKSSTPTPFEPYVGGTASPNPDYPQAVKTVTGEQTITVSNGQGESQVYPINLGKNLANIPDCNISDTGYSLNIESGAIELNSTTINKTFDLCGGSAPAQWIPTYANANDYHLTPTGGTWTLNASDISGTISGTQSLYVTIMTNQRQKNTYISSAMTYTPYTITLADDEYIKSIYLWCSSNTTYTSVKFKLQLEKGSAATTYAPYFTPIELCKIGDYQDYIYKSGEDWYVHKDIEKFTMNGSENWKGDWNNPNTPNYWTAYLTKANFTDNYDSTVAGTVNSRCSHFVHSPTNSIWNLKDFGVAMNPDATYTLQFKMAKTFKDNVADWKTWLGLNNMVYYYPLATPTDTQITNADLIAQLEALNSATTYAGVTWFKTESEYLPADTWAYVQIQAGGGVVCDNYGATWEEGGGGMIVNVNVDSIENVYPVWTVNGPTDTPILTNLTTGTSITYSGNITASQTLVVDMLNQTALLNGTSVIGKLSGDWIELAPGMNRMSYTATNEQTAPKSTLEWQEIVG